MEVTPLGGLGLVDREHRIVRVDRLDRLGLLDRVGRLGFLDRLDLVVRVDRQRAVGGVRLRSAGVACGEQAQCQTRGTP
jgi:hypothetical protein